MKENSLKIELLLLLLFGFDAHFRVELVHSMSVLAESLGEIETHCLNRTAATDMGMIESKQCEDELGLVLSFG